MGLLMTLFPPSTALNFRVRLQRVVIASAMLLAVAPTFPASAQLPPLPESAFYPVVENGKIIPAAHGLWTVPGYGDMYALSSGGAALYQFAGGLCWRAPADSDLILTKASVYYARSQQPRDFVLASSPQSTQLHALKIPQLPIACADWVDRSRPLYTFDAVSLTLKHLYAYNRERAVDWNARIMQLRPSAVRARTDAELKPVMAELLHGLDDLHTMLLGSADGQLFEIQGQRGAHFSRLRSRFEQQPRDELFLDWMQTWITQERAQADAQLLPGSRRSELEGRVAWGRLPDGVGYLAITAMGGYGDTEADNRAVIGPVIDKALADLQGTRALVLDIAHNLGGLDMVSAEIAARFADRERLAYTKRAHANARIQPQPVRIAPGGQSRYQKPVYLLTSEFTCSAAETFAMMMRTLPNVNQVGQPTQGIFSDGLAKLLPNGWIFSLSNEVYRDPWGISYETRGLPPDYPIVVYPERETQGSYGRALQRVARLAAGR